MTAAPSLNGSRPADAGAGTPVSRLRVEGLGAGYGRLPVLHEVSLRVDAGELVAVLGANGAGKSTLLRTISGALPARGGVIELDGRSIAGLSPDQVVRRGLAHVLEGRHVFGALSVLENLDLGSIGRPRAEARQTLGELLEIFPDLARLRHLRGGALSGGQQQQLAVARALMSRPRVLLLDEPSIGLSPHLVQSLCKLLAEVVARFQTSVVLVEQAVWMARELARRGYVLEHGRIVYDGPLADLGAGVLADVYLGDAAPEAAP
jgi:branched-chain amino acid transport system ATP-binding protein